MAAELRYAGVGTFNNQPVDLVVTTDAVSYETTPQDQPQFSGCNERFGVISVRGGATVPLRFDFVAGGTNTPVVLPQFVFSIFDLDDDGNERVAINGFARFTTSSQTNVIDAGDCSSIVGLPFTRNGCHVFESCVTSATCTFPPGACPGSACPRLSPQPTDPNQLSDRQAAAAITFTFYNASGFDVLWGMPRPLRNSNSRMFFQGSSSLVDACPPPPSSPPMPPPPTDPPLPPSPPPPVHPPPSLTPVQCTTLNFDFFHSQLAFSNLGGFGPDASRPPSIRYANVAVVPDPVREVAIYLDLEVTAASNYRPTSAERNGLSGRFARINFYANSCADLRVSVKPSCATEDSCDLCDDARLHPTDTARAACYARGCACFGTTITTPAECEGTSRETLRSSYSCPQMDLSATFPPGALIAFSVYDMDNGANNDVRPPPVMTHPHAPSPLTTAVSAPLSCVTMTVR
jgi:hypothetical protein